MNSTHIGNIDLHTAWHAARDAINPRPDGACASRLRTATIVGPSRSKKTSLARLSTLHSQVPKAKSFLPIGSGGLREGERPCSP
jgi:hypothetical protein